MKLGPLVLGLKALMDMHESNMHKAADAAIELRNNPRFCEASRIEYLRQRELFHAYEAQYLSLQ